MFKNPTKRLKLAADLSTAAAFRNPKILATTPSSHKKFIQQRQGLLIFIIHVCNRKMTRLREHKIKKTKKDLKNFERTKWVNKFFHSVKVICEKQLASKNNDVKNQKSNNNQKTENKTLGRVILKGPECYNKKSQGKKLFQPILSIKTQKTVVLLIKCFFVYF